MDIGALRQEDYQVWMPFLDAEVLVRHLALEEIQEIGRKATRVSWDRKHRKTEAMNSVEAARLLGRAAVRGWRGITMEGGEFLYSPENCDLLMTRWSEFLRFVSEACMDLQALVEEEKNQKIKNSGLTSGQE